MKPSRSAKNGALIGGAAGVAKGTFDGVRKVKSESEDGTFQLTGESALVVGKHAAVNGAVGAAVGFGVGELGDQLLSGDGMRAVAKKGAEAKEYATANHIEGEAKDQFLKAMKSSVRDARRARLNSPGNKMLLGRGELGWFGKNRLVPTKPAAGVANAVFMAQDAIAEGAAPGASALQKLMAKVAEKDPMLWEALDSGGWSTGPEGLEQLKSLGERLSDFSSRDARALGKLYRTQGEALTTAWRKIEALPPDESAQVLNTSAEKAKSVVDWYKKVIAAASELASAS